MIPAMTTGTMWRRWRRSVSLSLSLSLSLCVGLTSALVGQGTASPPPERVIHLWVDPRGGNDVSAVQQNPGPNALPFVLCSPTQTAPNSVVDPNQSGAPLLHASWPFKTVTAAIAYIRSINPGASQPLPYQSPSTGVVWVQAIIHCLPGVYSSATWHPDNGILGNGESFPIHLPNNVSIQGTSALNTVFDILGDTGGNGPIFEFGVTGGGLKIEGENCVISTVSLTGARHRALQPRLSCAVMLERELHAAPTFTNCVIFKNEIGVLVSASHEGPVIAHDGTTFFHNTFAFNRCGLWNGQAGRFGNSSPIDPARGLSRLIVVNNLFDASDTSLARYNDCRVRSWGLTDFGSSACGFIGVCAEDMVVTSPIPSGSVVGAQTNYNAWEEVYTGTPAVPLRFNDVNIVVPSLPNCAIRLGSTQPTTDPSRQIQVITGFSSVGNTVPRGILFVRDLLCNTGFGRGDRSPMDFRLAPAQAFAAGAATPPALRNRLVDNGWGTGLATDFPMTMQNGLSLASRPGTVSLGSSQGSWPYSMLVYDAEGYGNPRYFNHPDYPPGTYSFGVADIGADELGDLIAAGYLYGTTSFVHLPLLSQRHPYYNASPNPSSDFLNDQMAHLGRPGTLGGAPPGGVASLAFSSTQFPPQINDYDFGVWTGVWRFMGGIHDYGYTYYSPAPFEIVPHLLPDVHPWWITAIAGYPANPFWQPTCLPPPTQYNIFLYANPAAPVINPAGAYPSATNARWLHSQAGVAWLFPVAMFDYVDPVTCQFRNWQIGGSFDAWGYGVDSFGDTSQFLCPLFSQRLSRFGSCQAPAAKRLATYQGGQSNPTGVRVTVERVLWGPGNGGAIWSGTVADNNLQTFSVLIEDSSSSPACPR